MRLHLGGALFARHRPVEDTEPRCGCHPAYHELGVHAPGWRPETAKGRCR